MFAQTQSKDYIDGRIFVKLKDNYKLDLPYQAEMRLTDLIIFSQVFSHFSVAKIERPFFENKYEPLQRTFRIYFSNFAEVDGLVKELSQLADVDYAEKEALHHLFTSDDPYYGDAATMPLQGGINFIFGNKWFLDQIEAEAAWAIHEGTAATKVAVIDGAIWASHPDLNVVAQYNGVDQTANSSPPTTTLTADEKYNWSHGTHCAGLVSAKSNNTVGVASIGRNLAIIGVRIADNSDQLTGFSNGFNWVVTQNQAKVVSMSLGGPSQSATEQNLMNSAHNAGMILIAAAGNDNVTTQMYPAAYTNVIAIASVGKNNKKSDFSNYGPWIDVAAPGGNNGAGTETTPPTEDLNMLLSTTFCVTTDYEVGGSLAIDGKMINGNALHGNYHVMSGTSMACPVAAGLAGLMVDYGVGLTPDTITYCLLSSADDLSTLNPTYPGELGSGRINARKAMECLQAISNNSLNAAFVGSPLTVGTGGTVTFTDQSTGTPTSWLWTFQGGNPATSTSQNPTVTYAAIGNYTVTLKVTKGATNDTETKTAYIHVVDPATVPLAAFTGTPTSIVVGSSVNYTDQSTGNPTAWAWTFDGGTPSTSTVQNPTNIVYNTVGTYNVKLKITTANGTDSLTKTSYISVVAVPPAPPKALFVADYTTVVTGSTVTYTDQSTGNPTSWSWTFEGGNPATSTSQNPSVVYNTTGTFDAKLKVTNAGGNDSLIKVDYITVTPPATEPPIANFMVYNHVLYQGDDLQYYDQSTGGTPSSWAWSFEGGTPSTSNLQNPIVTYNTAGIFKTSLTVTNPIGTDTEEKLEYVYVSSTQVINYCNYELTNIQTGESTRNAINPTGSWGYLTGHNGLNVTNYADLYSTYIYNQVNGLIVPAAKKIVSGGPGSKVRFKIWSVGSDNKPNQLLGYKDVLISSLTQNTYNQIMFNTPVVVNGNFFAGYEIYYSSADTFAVYMASSRASSGLNTLYGMVNSEWKSAFNIFGINTSTAIKPIVCAAGIGINEPIDFSKQVIIYPNPSRDKVNILFQDLQIRDLEIAVYDIAGREIQVKKEEGASNEILLDFSENTNGMYFIRIKIDNEILTRKISIIK